MRFSVAAAVTLVALPACVGCSSPRRSLAVVPTLPRCVAADAVNSLRLSALGDFAPAAPLTASASALGDATLDLPRATRVVAVDGFGPGGLAAFGRTAPLSLDDVGGGRIGIAFGPPDGLCATAAPAVARSGHRATLLAAGNVLVSGGWDGDGPATNLELYLPNGDVGDGLAHFRLVNATLDRRAALAHAVAALTDGGALLSGGVAAGSDGQPDGIASQGATRHDANGERVGEPHLLPDPRAGHTATTLPDGRVLLAGGCAQFSDGSCMAGAALATTLLYDPAGDQVSAGPPLGHARWGHTALLRGDGSVLLVGGVGEGGAALPAELVDPDEARSFDAGLVAGAAALLPTGAALVAGGVGSPDVTATLWLSADEPPLPLPPLADPRRQPTVTTLEDGAALIAGGGTGPLYVYDGRGQLLPLAATFDARGHTATRLADGSVLLVGGSDAAGIPAARALVYFRSQLSPYANLPPLTLDTAADPLLPRRPDRAQAEAGQLVVSAASPRADGAPAEWTLLAGEEVADFTLTLTAGRHGDGGAALLLGYQSEAAYAFVAVAPGQPVALWTVSAPRAGQTVVAAVAGCGGAPLADGALPDGATSPLTLSWRGGRLTLTAGGLSTTATTLLSCRPGSALAAGSHGRVGFGALQGTAVFAAPTLTR